MRRRFLSIVFVLSGACTGSVAPEPVTEPIVESPVVTAPSVAAPTVSADLPLVRPVVSAGTITQDGPQAIDPGDRTAVLEAHLVPVSPEATAPIDDAP